MNIKVNALLSRERLLLLNLGAPKKKLIEFRDFDFMSPWEGAQHILPGDEKAQEEEGAEG